MPLIRPSKTRLLLHGEALADSSLNGYSVSAVGGAAVDSGQSVFGGSSFQFTGGGLAVEDAAGLNRGTADWSISLRFRAGTQSSAYPSLLIGAGGWAPGCLAVHPDYPATGTLTLNHYDHPGNTIASVGSVVTDGTWQHLLIRRSGTALEAVLDEAVIVSASISAGLTFDFSALSVGGGNVYADNAYVGHVDELLIYDEWITANATPSDAYDITVDGEASLDGGGAIAGAGGTWHGSAEMAGGGGEIAAQGGTWHGVATLEGDGVLAGVGEALPPPPVRQCSDLGGRLVARSRSGLGGRRLSRAASMMMFSPLLSIRACSSFPVLMSDLTRVAAFSALRWSGVAKAFSALRIDSTLPVRACSLFPVAMSDQTRVAAFSGLRWGGVARGCSSFQVLMRGAVRAWSELRFDPIGEAVPVRAYSIFPVLMRAAVRSWSAFPVSAGAPMSVRAWSELRSTPTAAGPVHVGEWVWRWIGQRIDATGSPKIDAGGNWSATLTIGDVGIASRMRRGDAVSLTLGNTTWQFLVDSVQRGFTGAARREYSYGLLGIATRLEARATPITRVWDDAISARSVCEELAGGPIDWNILNWMIPAGRLVADAESPLAIIRRVVGAVKGLVEPNPDGTLVARYETPVSVPRMATTAPDIELSERVEIFDASGSIAWGLGGGSVEVTDAEIQYSDRLEWVADSDASTTGKIWAYPSPWRPVRLHCTHSAVTILSGSREEERTIEQRVEFRAGMATTSHDVASIISVAWETTSLGGVTAIGGTDLRAGIQGESLATVRYRTRGVTWDVDGANDITAQFVLIDDYGV